MNVKEVWKLIKRTIREWQEDKASRFAAALAYYTVFSLAPLLLIVIVVVGAIWGEEAARGQVYSELEDTAGADTAEMVQNMIQNVSESQAGGVAAVVGIAGLLIGATSIIAQLQDALNAIWEVRRRSGGGIVGMLKDRGMALLMIGGIGALLLLSLVIDTVLNGLSDQISDLLPNAAYVTLLQIVNVAIGLGLLTLAFALVFKVLPDVDIAWEDVWVGALTTAVLFTIGRYAISLYIARTGTTSAYGAAGSLIVILLWVYYSAQIFFLGAEFTQVYARRHGKSIVPSEKAVPLSAEERVRQGIARPEPAAAKSDAGAAPEPAPEKRPSRKRLTSYAVAAVLAFVAGAVAGFFGDKGQAQVDTQS